MTNHLLVWSLVVVDMDDRVDYIDELSTFVDNELQADHVVQE